MSYIKTINDKINLKSIILLFALFFNVVFINAQQSSKEQIKRVQRTIFIYNLANQIAWPSSNNLETFTIGVLGPDRSIVDLKVMSQNRKINNKQVTVIDFDKVKDVKGVQLLFVNNRFNYDIDYIIRHLHNKGILLISEDYNYNSSMINMVNVENSFEYEINKGLLIAENFTLAPSLEQNAVTSAEKWKNLFTTTKNKLEVEQQLNTENQAEISNNKNQILDKNKTIGSQKTAIDNQVEKIYASEQLLKIQKDSLAQLLVNNELQAKKYEDKVILEKELEHIITEQIQLVEEQQDAIKNSKSILESQQLELKQKQEQINSKQQILDTQNLTIEDQRNTSMLLAVIAALLLLGGLLLFFNYKTKRKLVKELELKNNEAQTQEKLLVVKNKELEQFAYIASHDLQEPLNSIISLISILEEDYIDAFDDSGKQSLLYITESSYRMRELINALLRHSKLGKIDNIKPVDTQQLLVRIKRDLKDVISKTQAEINFKDLPVISASGLELGLVFQNLITNAIKFIAPGTNPIINIEVANITSKKNPEKNYWEFTIADNGIGIPPQYQDRIFSIFQRLHTRDTYSGTGIGLAHVKKIIDAHGGDVWVKSEEGKGSVFHFTIPNS